MEHNYVGNCEMHYCSHLSFLKITKKLLERQITDKDKYLILV